MQIPVQRLLLRNTWLKAHLYLALSAGFFFAIISVTGSLTIYQQEIDELLNPQLVIKHPQGNYQSLDRIMAAVRAAHPDRHGSWTLEMPKTRQNMITVWYDKPDETFFEYYAPLMVSVNPYTAEVVCSRFWGQTVTTWVLDLHTQLNLNRFGWNVVGILGLLLMVSVSTGVYLWWSDKRQLLTLALRYRDGIMELLFDLHRLTGLFFAVILIILTVTGFNLSFPSLLETLLGTTGMQHGSTGRPLISTAVPNNHPTRLESAEFIARGAFPQAKLRRITTPVGEMGIYRINLRQNSEINKRHPFTTVWIDRWSGQIKEVRDPAQFSTGETLITWIWPLHTGEAFGTTGRFLWFLSGFAVFFLYVSGVILYLYRCGLIQNRKPNFIALKSLINYCYPLCCLIAMKLWLLLQKLIQILKFYSPVIIAVIVQAQYKIRLLIKNKAKRIGTNRIE